MHDDSEEMGFVAVTSVRGEGHCYSMEYPFFQFFLVVVSSIGNIPMVWQK